MASQKNSIESIMTLLSEEERTALRRVNARADKRAETLRPVKRAIKNVEAEIDGKHEAESIAAEKAEMMETLRAGLVIVRTSGLKA